MGIRRRFRVVASEINRDEYDRVSTFPGTTWAIAVDLGLEMRNQQEEAMGTDALIDSLKLKYRAATQEEREILTKMNELYTKLENAHERKEEAEQRLIAFENFSGIPLFGIVDGFPCLVEDMDAPTLRAPVSFPIDWRRHRHVSVEPTRPKVWRDSPDLARAVPPEACCDAAAPVEKTLLVKRDR